MQEAQKNTNQAPTIINVTCSHCKQQVRMHKPTRPGYYKVPCPHCQKSFAVKLANRAAEQAGAQGRAVVSCPKCLHPIAFRPKQPGIYRLTCPNDEHVFAVRVLSPTEGNSISKEKEAPADKKQSQQSEHQAPPPEPITSNNNEIKMPNHTESTIFMPNEKLACTSEAAIVLHRRLLQKLVFPLKEGNNIIGRPDDSNVPDIAIPNDITISRRSINIEKTPSQRGAGNFYRLTVLKSTNPVYVNGKPIATGESTFLNFGDKITLGKTILCFEEQ